MNHDLPQYRAPAGLQQRWAGNLSAGPWQCITALEIPKAYRPALEILAKSRGGLAPIEREVERFDIWSWEVFHNRQPAGAILWRWDPHHDGVVFHIVAAVIDAPSSATCELLPEIERYAAERGAVRLQFETARPGLVALAERAGYGRRAILEKDLKP